MIAVLTFLAGASGAVSRFVLDAYQATVAATVPVGDRPHQRHGIATAGGSRRLVLFHGQSSTWQTIIGTGFCGGYTTFSTASFETVRLVEQGRRLLGLLNAVGSLVASVAACAAGLALVWAL